MKNFNKLIAIGAVAVMVTVFSAPSALAMTISNSYEFTDTIDLSYSLDSATESDGTIHLAEMHRLNNGYQIDYYSRSSAGTWNEEAVVVASDKLHGPSWKDLSIAVGSTGNPGITWLEGNSDGSGDYLISDFVIKFAYSNDGGLNWGTYDVVDTGSIWVEQAPVLAFNSNDVPYIYDSGTGNTLYRGVWTGSTFDFTTNAVSVPITDPAKGADMIIDSNDNIHIVTAPNDDEVQYNPKYAKGSDGGNSTTSITWSVSNEDIVSGSVEDYGDRISLDLYNGFPRIAMVMGTDYLAGYRGAEWWNASMIYTGYNGEVTSFTYPKIIADQHTGEDYVYSQRYDYNSSIVITKISDWSNIFIETGLSSSIITQDISELGDSTTVSPGNGAAPIISLSDSPGEGIKAIFSPGINMMGMDYCGYAGNGGDYDASFHSYTYDGNPYGGVIGPLSSWIYDPIEPPLPVDNMMGMSSLNCVIDETPSDWHLLLMDNQQLIEYGGDHEYGIYYFSSENYAFTNDPAGRASMQIAVDNYFEEWGLESSTIEAYRLNAFAYDSQTENFTFFETENATSGSTISLMAGSDGASVSATVTNATVEIINGEASEEEPPGGEPVPEFKDYLLIVTIALALGLAYKVIPKTQLTRA